jgi:hypothetical protein
MQLQKVIFPEILLDLRGDASARTFFKKVRDGVVSVDDGSITLKEESFARSVYKKEEHHSFCVEHKMYSDFLKTKEIYYIPADFSLALSKVDLRVSTSILPKSICAYFQVPDNKFTFPGNMGDELFEGGFVRIFTPPEDWIEKVRGLNEESYQAYKQTSLHVDFLLVTKIPQLSCYSVHAATFPVLAGHTIEEIMSMHSSNGTGHEKYFLLYRLLLNSAIYAHSADPELAKLVPRRELTKPEQKAQRDKNGGMENMCMLPITVLNRSYSMGREYSMDSSKVTGHFRWQPCGEKWNQVKLIWIDEFERTYKKPEDVVTNSTQEL